MKKVMIGLMCLISFNLFAQELDRITSISNKSIVSNQVAFSTGNIPAGASVTVYCKLDNQADFSGYLYVTPYSGSFSGVRHQNCTPSGCGNLTGSKIYLGMANTNVTIYGVSQSNQAVVFTNYSAQNLTIYCAF